MVISHTQLFFPQTEPRLLSPSHQQRRAVLKRRMDEGGKVNPDQWGRMVDQFTLAFLFFLFTSATIQVDQLLPSHYSTRTHPTPRTMVSTTA